MKSQLQPTKKTLLYVITQGMWGGAQQYVFDTATEMIKTHRVLIAMGFDPNSSRFKEELKTYNQSIPKNQQIELISVKHLHRSISPVHDLLAIFELAKIYKFYKPDCIHLHSSKAGVLGSFARLLARKKDYSILYTVHGWVFLEPLPILTKSVYLGLEYISSRLKNTIIVLSQKEYNIAKNTLHIPKSKLSLIPIGLKKISFLTTSEARNQLGLTQRAKGKKCFVTIANFYPSKGIMTLLQAIAEKKETLAQALFVLIGEGPQRTMYESFIREHDLTNQVYLTGEIPHAAQFLRAFDGFILPSHKEGLPYAIFEAMQAELPIIATSVGGITEIIEQGKNGLLVEPQKSSQLGDKIEMLLREPHLFTDLGKEAAKRSVQFSFETMMKKIRTLY